MNLELRFQLLQTNPRQSQPLQIPKISLLGPPRLSMGKRKGGRIRVEASDNVLVTRVRFWRRPGIWLAIGASWFYSGKMDRSTMSFPQTRGRDYLIPSHAFVLKGVPHEELEGDK